MNLTKLTIGDLYIGLFELEHAVRIAEIFRDWQPGVTVVFEGMTFEDYINEIARRGYTSHEATCVDEIASTLKSFGFGESESRSRALQSVVDKNMGKLEND